MRSFYGPVRTAAVIIVIGFLSSCSGATEIAVYVEDGLIPEWLSLTETHPPPGEITFYRGTDKGSPVALLSGKGDIAGKTMSRNDPVPVTELWDPRWTVDEAEAGEMPRLSIDEIVLPVKGLAVNGKYPGDPGYPLTERVALSISPEGLGEETAEIVRAWFDAIPEAPAPRAVAWIAGTGDIMPGRGVDTMLMADGGERAVFGDVLPLMLESDLILGNLEGCVSTRGERLPKTYTFRFYPAVLGGLKRA